MKAPPPEIIEMDVEKLQVLRQRAADEAFEKEDYPTILQVLESYFYVTNLIDQKSTTLARLRKLLFGASTEKTSEVVGRAEETPAVNAAADPSGEPGGEPNSEPGDNSPPAEAPRSAREKKPGHGRNGAKKYSGADRVQVPHSTLQPGDDCPACGEGTAYEMMEPGLLVRLVGRPPVGATIYELQKLRCHLCGQVFTAKAPAEAGPAKYAATAASMIALLKYGTGMPFNRSAGLQKNLGVPLPASTQWDVVSAAAPSSMPAYQELIRQAAQGEVVYNDDTTVKILEMMGKRAKDRVPLEPDPDEDQPPGSPERTGLFTSAVVATTAGRQIALFFSGRKHAGENLTDVLRKRADELLAPIQMSDALSRNRPREFQTIVANCLAHGRRNFVDVNERFPAACRYVLEALEEVYRIEAVAKERKLSPEERLAYHQAHSGPVMEDLRVWLKQQLEERLVEPNSGLGAAINYLRKHWDGLTLFLQKAGAPLDNNICERALKKAILHRKNAYFYKTPNGAAVGDMYMSLIYTCELCGANPFDYLTALQQHADEVATDPAAWMPWNYRAAVAPETAAVLA